MANDAGKAAKTYTLSSGSETYTAALASLTTANSPASVTIDGGGRVVTSTANSTVSTVSEGNGITVDIQRSIIGTVNRFTVGSGVTLTLKNITFKALPFAVSAGGKLVLDTGAVVRENDWTGVLVDGGTLEMRAGSSVTENRYWSGVRMVGTGSKFTMNGGEISLNTSTGAQFYDDGGGVAILGANAVFTMNGGSIHDNTSLYIGGGILAGLGADNSTLKLTGGEIYNNYALIDGGGVYIYHGLNATFDMSGGKIRNNEAIYVWDNGRAVGNGGGVYIGGGNIFNMTSGEITDNISGWHGAGVYVTSGSTFNMTGGDITRNNAEDYGDGVYLESGAALTGNPSIGSKVNGKGSIYGNDSQDLVAN
jgi:hypothetical protein